MCKHNTSFTKSPFLWSKGHDMTVIFRDTRTVPWNLVECVSSCSAEWHCGQFSHFSHPWNPIAEASQPHINSLSSCGQFRKKELPSLCFFLSANIGFSSLASKTIQIIKSWEWTLFLSPTGKTREAAPHFFSLPQTLLINIWHCGIDLSRQ